MKLSSKGLTLIQQFEGFSAKPYLDRVNVCTIGYGCTYYLDGRKVKLTDKPLTKQQASDLQLAIINRDFAPKITKLLDEQIKSRFVTQNMFDACVSLAYNIGMANFTGSSVVKYIKATNKIKAADSFLLWKMAQGIVLQGLINRRTAERKLLLS